MNQLDMNKYQAAHAALALLGLKHTSDKVANAVPVATASPSNLTQALQLAEEQKKAKAHEALAAMNTQHNAAVVADLTAQVDEIQNVVEAEIITDEEIEIRVGNKIVRITVE